MIDLNKFSNKDKASILHSSGHAQLGHGSQIGSAGSQTFMQRLQLADRARSVADYRHSIVGARRGAQRARQFQPTQRLAGDEPHRITPRPEGKAGAAPRPGFREPPRRGYDPYAH